MTILDEGLLEVGVRRDTTVDRRAVGEIEIKKDAGFSRMPVGDLKWAVDHVSAEKVALQDSRLTSLFWLLDPNFRSPFSFTDFFPPELS